MTTPTPAPTSAIVDLSPDALQPYGWVAPQPVLTEMMESIGRILAAPKTPALPFDDEPCECCHGSGECFYCDGKGERNGIFGVRKCGVCDGTGLCNGCHDTAAIAAEIAEQAEKFAAYRARQEYALSLPVPCYQCDGTGEHGGSMCYPCEICGGAG